jgi:hypothetical protein
MYALAGLEPAVGTSGNWLQKRNDPSSSITLNNHRSTGTFLARVEEGVGAVEFIERRVHKQTLRQITAVQPCKQQCALYLAFVATKSVNFAHIVYLCFLFS